MEDGGCGRYINMEDECGGLNVHANGGLQHDVLIILTVILLLMMLSKGGGEVIGSGGGVS